SRALVAQLSTSVVLNVSLDWRMLVFTAAVAVVSAVLFGVVPAWRATRAAPIDALKEPASALRAKAGWPGLSGAGRGSGSVVVVQIALSLMLVVTAGLFVRTFQRLASVPLGFDSDRVLLVNVDATRSAIDPASRLSFSRRLVEAVAAVPGVAHAAGSDITPASGHHKRFPVDVSGGLSMPLPERAVRVHDITPGWFATYGTRIRAGRDFDQRDAINAPPVAIVNEAFARKFFSGKTPIGQTVTELPPPGSDEVPVPKTVVGVVDDAVYRTPRDGVEPTLYEPLNGEASNINISARASSGSPVSLARSVAAALTAVDRNLAFSFRPLADQVNASFAQERLVALLSGLFGALAVLLAGIGLYGVTSYAVTCRQHEIGVRMALGAERASVIVLVLRKSIALTAIGLLLGLAGAALATRYLEAMLFGVTPLDPVTFFAVP
ncbi:MAG: FtsX-like permease family protein, partial [Luteitalea sp.]|nr:FtsX-like permease family protein [Luteitalea sp.]